MSMLLDMSIAQKAGYHLVAQTIWPQILPPGQCDRDYYHKDSNHAMPGGGDRLL